MAKKYGRTYKTKKYDNIQMEVGVINNEFPKSIYCDIKCYIKSVDTNYRQNIRKFLKSIENTIELNIDTVLFNKRFIFISDIPDTMVTKGDGFVSFSINLFLNHPEDFCNKHYVQKIETLVEIIVDKNFNDSELFHVSKSNRKNFKNFYNL